MSSTKAQKENKSYLKQYGWPSWFIKVSSLALTVWIVSGVLLLVMTIVGTFFTATRVNERDTENDIWILAGYALVVNLYGGVVCLMAAMNGYARMASTPMPPLENEAQTTNHLYAIAQLPMRLDKLFVPVGAVSLGQAGALFIALVYFLLTMGSVIPDTFYFVLSYVGFLVLLILSSLAGGLCLLTAAKSFQKMRDVSVEKS